jgi:hypothetical protein
MYVIDKDTRVQFTLINTVVKFVATVLYLLHVIELKKGHATSHANHTGFEHNTTEYGKYWKNDIPGTPKYFAPIYSKVWYDEV